MKGRVLFLLLTWSTLTLDDAFGQLSVVDIARHESTGRFKFFISDLAVPSRAHEFTNAIKEAQSKVEVYWGKTFHGAFWVEVSLRHRISMALIPAWRGEHGKMVFPVHRVNEKQAAIIHEMVHVYAPNQNRFLAEGLAVYLHHKLGGNPAFPNFGRNLSGLTDGVFPGLGLAELDAISTPRRLELSGRIDEKSAYIVAGSFVGFLIENYGVEKFKGLYALSPLQPRQRLRDTNREERNYHYASIFTKNLGSLEREWRGHR